MANNVVLLRKVKSIYIGNIFSVKAEGLTQNGSIGALGGNLEGETEIRELKQAVATDKVVLVAEPELVYDNAKTIDSRLDAFKIEAGKVCRAYDLEANDEIAITSSAIKGSVGKYVVADTTGFGFKYSATIPEGTTFVAEVIGTSKLGTGYFGTFNSEVKGGIIDMTELRVISN